MEKLLNVVGYFLIFLAFKKYGPILVQSTFQNEYATGVPVAFLRNKRILEDDNLYIGLKFYDLSISRIKMIP